MSIIGRVKFDGLHSRDWLVYKYPSENLVLGTKLIVGEGQAAVFVKDGQMFDLFFPGTYTLSTNNLPLLNKIINFTFGSHSPFPAEVYFVNLSTKLDMYWGTPAPIQLIDPKYFIKLRIRAFGQLALKMDDPILFFKEIVGSMNQYELVDYEKVRDYFKGTLITTIKTSLANKIIKEKISALEITPELQSISDDIQQQVASEFSTYGFSLIHFRIQSINFPDEDFEQINHILQDKAKFEIMGENRHITQRSFDIYEKVASNNNGVAGAYAAGGIELGAGLNMASNMMQHVQAPESKNNKTCSSCHATVLATSKFCSSCGELLDSLEITCHQCHQRNVETSKFCSSCGTSLAKLICECGNKLKYSDKFCNHCGKAQHR